MANQIPDGVHPIGPAVRGWFFGAWAPVRSSNVARMRYTPERAVLDVKFNNGSWYRYYNVSEQEAIDLHAAVSAGIWLWDHVRVRGSRVLHKKPWVKVA